MNPWVIPIALGIVGGLLADKLFASKVRGSCLVGLIIAAAIESYIRWSDGYWDKFSLVAFLAIFIVSAIVARATMGIRQHFWPSDVKRDDTKYN